MKASICIAWLMLAKKDFTSPWGDCISEWWRNTVLDLMLPEFMLPGLMLIKFETPSLIQIHIYHTTWQEAKGKQVMEDVMTKCDGKTQEHLLAPAKSMVLTKTEVQEYFQITNSGKFPHRLSLTSILYVLCNNLMTKFFFHRAFNIELSLWARIQLIFITRWFQLFLICYWYTLKAIRTFHKISHRHQCPQSEPMALIHFAHFPWHSNERWSRKY